jgi:DNA ligase 1
VRAMQALVDALDHPNLAMVAQHRLDDAAALDQRLQTVLALGGEGLMLHHTDARYRDGRSDTLLKLTPHEDAEARVVGHTPGRGKYRGKTCALVVEREDGRRFRLGSGLSDGDRADPPPVGSLVTYRFNGLTSTGLPRFARYLRVRHD